MKFIYINRFGTGPVHSRGRWPELQVEEGGGETKSRERVRERERKLVFIKANFEKFTVLPLRLF